MTSHSGHPAAILVTTGRQRPRPMEVTLMHVRKSLVETLAKLAAVFVPAPVAPQRPLTEDDLASEKFLQRVNRDRAIVRPEPGQPRRAA